MCQKRNKRVDESQNEAGQDERHLLGNLMSCVSCLTCATNSSVFYNMLVSCLCQMAHTYPTDTVNLHSERRIDFCSVYMQACWSIPQMSIHGSKIVKSGSKTDESKNESTIQHLIQRIHHLFFWLLQGSWNKAVNTTLILLRSSM